MASTPRPQPGTLIDLAIQMHRDEAEPLDKLRTRDRAVGQALSVPPAVTPDGVAESPRDRAGWITAWLKHIDQPVHRGSEAMATLSLAAVLIGLVLGYGAAMALFYYNGESPVNVVRILAVFVAFQAVTLLLFVLAALPGRLPGTRMLRSFSPGRWATVVVRWLPGETRDALQSIIGRAGAHQVVYGRVQKWQVLSWSQAMAVAFNVAAIAGALQLIVFSDLSFGWSTTLDVDAADMHRVTESLSWPWHNLFRGDRPDLVLVEQTQIYRAQEFELDKSGARASAQWWPFLMMCMLVYGLLPRVVCLCVARWRLGQAVVRAVAITPGVDRLRDRLVSSLVETRAAEHEAERESDGPIDPEPLPIANPQRVIRWAEAGDDLPHALHAGGDRTFAQDRAAIDFAAAGGAGSTVRVLTKAWEPPVLEFLDFLGDLRSAIGEGRVIEVQPLGEGDLAVWRKKIASVGDPWLRVVRDGPPAISISDDAQIATDHAGDQPSAGESSADGGEA